MPAGVQLIEREDTLVPALAKCSRPTSGTATGSGTPTIWA
jgi:hypothetical protein